MSAKPDPLQAAWRHCNALTAAIAAGRHNCWCGHMGVIRFSRTGPWHCWAHTFAGPDGLRHPIPQS